MIHSNGPMVPTGYGRQTALAIRQLRSLGHEVAVSAFYGAAGAIVDWQGTTVYPAGIAPYGVDVLVPHARHWGADVVITLMDTWKLRPVAGLLAELHRGGTPVGCWTPVDCTPLGRADREVLAAGVVPIAMSKFGHRQMVEAGLRPLYVPHSIDLGIFQPSEQTGRAVREELGIEDRFVVGICAANNDAVRKAWPEQFRAFDLFRRTYPDAMLLVHTIAAPGRGWDLRGLATDMGIGDAVRFTDEYPQMAGLFDDHDMAAWFNTIDVLSGCSYAEGFGLPLIEAQACGRPALGTDASAMTELASRLVRGDEFWNPVHRAWWYRPRPEEIAAEYGRVVREHGRSPEKHVAAVAGYGVDQVAAEHWKPALDALTGGAGR